MKSMYIVVIITFLLPQLEAVGQTKDLCFGTSRAEFYDWGDNQNYSYLLGNPEADINYGTLFAARVHPLVGTYDPFDNAIYVYFWTSAKMSTCVGQKRLDVSNPSSNINYDDITLIVNNNVYGPTSGDAIQLSGSHNDIWLDGTYPNDFFVSGEYSLLIQVRVPIDPNNCNSTISLDIATQRYTQFNNWATHDQTHLSATVTQSLESSTNGTLNTYTPGSTVYEFGYDEPINLDLSSSMCESKYTVEIVETFANGQPKLEPGTNNYLNGAIETVVGQGPSNINIRNWTGGGSEPIVQGSEASKYYRIKIATYPSWDEKFFFFKVGPVNCDLLTLDGPDHVYNGLSDAEEAANNSFHPFYMSDPDNYLPYSWNIIKTSNVTVPSQASIYFTYGGALCQITFGPNDVGEDFKLVLNTNCPYDPNYYFDIEYTFTVEEYGSGAGLNSPQAPDFVEDMELGKLYLGDQISSVDGTDYSNINSVYRETHEKDNAILMPNPISSSNLSNLKLELLEQYPKGIRIDISTLTGSLISSDRYKVLTTQSKLNLDTKLSSGFYLVKIVDNATGKIIESEKLVVTK